MNKEDITYEYEKYFSNLMKESKTNLYIRAGEINCKRVFFQRLKEKGETLKNKNFLGIASDAADRFYFSVFPLFLLSAGRKLVCN